MEIRINKNWIIRTNKWFSTKNQEFWILMIAIVTAIGADIFYYINDRIVTYGDAESHLNIAKRVVDSITPGMAQLGGIWLPLPHILLIPFVKFDFLWRSGLAGSIVSGVAFVIASLFIYKTVFFLTKSKAGSFLASLIFITNPNILYLQATPMTELTLISFYVLSSYYFIKFIQNDKRLIYLIASASFGFCAALSRYDGWFLILIEVLLLVIIYFPYEDMTKGLKDLLTNNDWKKWYKFEGMLILFSTVAFFSIVLWLGWDWLILGDPLYFTHSEFSAKSQQQGWLARGELPAYQNIWLSFLYYFVTSMSNVGVITWFIAIAGFGYYLIKNPERKKWIVALLLGNVFIFYVATLFMGQSVIFIPHITPPDYDWILFNVRYGVMMAPFAAIFIGYFFSKLKLSGKTMVILLLVAQFGLYYIGYSKIISLADGTEGLSQAKRPDAERFVKENYDGGLVLIDDFSRTVSIIRSGIPMQNIIYIGNKPYWEESFEAPEKYARWIIFQKNDVIWKNIYEPQQTRDRLFAHFNKVYESPDILIFRKQ